MTRQPSVRAGQFLDELRLGGHFAELQDQGRWGFSPSDRPDRYRNESALTWAPRGVAPFLIMHGTSDPTVGFINGLAFDNALRDNNKKAVLVLKGAKAPARLTEGVPSLFVSRNPSPTSSTRARAMSYACRSMSGRDGDFALGSSVNVASGDSANAASRQKARQHIIINRGSGRATVR